MNLDNWQRREMGTTASYGDQVLNRYYGYTNVPNAADTASVFCIRKIAVSGGVETVTWNDNSFASFNAKWSERAANFTAPSGALGFTYSGTNPLNFTWTRLAGVNTYNIEVRYYDGRLVDENGGLHFSTSTRTNTATYINMTNHQQQLYTAGTYSIYLKAVNAAGILTATHSFTL